LYALAIFGSEEHHGSRRYLSTLLRLEGSWLARLPTCPRVSRVAEVPIRDAQISHAERRPSNAVWNARRIGRCGAHPSVPLIASSPGVQPHG
jgi:hypothetical protein